MPIHTDAVIIGGGCNGTGLARDLAKRGLKVLLCEKSDLGAGATGSSSAMIHGGPRYLLNDVETTEHSCKDSGYIQKTAPHLLFRIPFLVPVPEKSVYGKASLLLHDVYFDVYDRYAWMKNGLPHARLSVEQLKSVYPGMDCEGLLGAVGMDEWGIDPQRLCLLNAQDAQYHGGTVLTYTQVVGVLRNQAGRVLGVKVQKEGSAETEDVWARVVVNCAGPWVQKVAGLASCENARVRPGKGVHLVYGRRVSHYAVTAEAVDGRQVFVMPHQNETWIGTTDTDYYGDLDALAGNKDEEEYLKQALYRRIPGLKNEPVIGLRVGVRNTVDGWGVAPDALSRGFKVVDHRDEGCEGLFSLIGGKLASYRMQAEEVANAVCAFLGHQGVCRTHVDALPGGKEAPSVDVLCKTYGISKACARTVLMRHGSRVCEVLDVGKETRTGYSVLDPAEHTMECEVRYCVRNEYVQHLSDLMTRCKLAMASHMGVYGVGRAARILGEERGLHPQEERYEWFEVLRKRLKMLGEDPESKGIGSAWWNQYDMLKRGV